MITFLKKTFNLSGCEIIIEPECSIYHQGEYVKCKFSVNGSKDYEQIADEISIILEESWATGSGKDRRTHRKDRVTSVVDSNVVLKLGSTFNYEFEAQLPPNCRLSDSSETIGWC